MKPKYSVVVETIINKLGYNNSNNLIKYDDIKNLKLSNHTMKIIQEVKPYAVYLIDKKPFIFFFEDNYNSEEFGEISKKIWNTQVPITFFCKENTVKVFNGSSLDIPTEKLDIVYEISTSNCNEYSNFSYWKIANQGFWDEFSSKYETTKLNEYLLSNITFLTDTLKKEYKIKFATKLVLRLIFIRYLIDRGVDIDYKGFSRDIEESQDELLTVIKSKQSLYALFAHLKSKFNGNLFDLGNEYDCLDLVPEVFSLLSEFLSGRFVFDNGQLSLFSLYDFNIIPVELISNIYEILLGKEIRKTDNAFYTPNYLVEYILDKTTLEFLKENKKYRLLDPACGSGVFLVDSYRRMVEENLNGNIYCDDDQMLKRMVEENIYGIDINEEAVDVTIFSIYLTILDYKDPKTLSEFTLPNLKGKNLIVSDFFDDENTSLLKNIEFDFILGNPPWGNVKSGMHREYCKSNDLEKMQQNNEIGRSFVFRTKDFSSKNTVCCFILHSKILYNQKKPAQNFRRFILKNTQIMSIVEMSSVRKLVFKNADAPAMIINYKYSCENNNSNRINYISLKPNIFFKLFNIIVVEKNDMKYVSQKMLLLNDWAWKTLVYGFSADIDLISRIKNKYDTLYEGILDQEPKLIFGAGVEYQIGDGLDASHLMGRPLLKSKGGVGHYYVNSSNTETFDRPNIHRPRERNLFEPPYVLNPTGVNVSNFKIRASYCDESFVSRKTMYIIKGEESQKLELFNLVGLLNSSLYSYLSLMLGSSIGIEREQRFMNEVFLFPYLFSEKISGLVEEIINKKKNFGNMVFDNTEKLIEDVDVEILNQFKLLDNKFVDYALNIQIPELTNAKDFDLYKEVSVDDMIRYSDCFNKQFTEIYNDYHISMNLYPNILDQFSVFELMITEDEMSGKYNVIDNADENKELLTRFCVSQYNDVFYQFKDVIQFGENSFFIVKPKYYKNWHPAIAEIDLADVIESIMSEAGGDE